MALKRKLTKAEWEKLSEHLQGEYRAEGNGYILDVEGDDDNSALKRAKDREKTRADEAEAKLAEIEAELDEARSGSGKKEKDIATLEKAHAKALKEVTDTSNAKIEKLTAFAKNKLIDGTATTIATKISTVPNLMAKAIKERLTVDFDGDEPTLKILGKDGKPSEMTLEQLSEEFVANKEFSGIIVGSKASGSGAGKDGLNRKNGALSPNPNDKPTSLASMRPEQLAEVMKQKREAEQQ